MNELSFSNSISHDIHVFFSLLKFPSTVDDIVLRSHKDDSAVVNEFHHTKVALKNLMGIVGSVYTSCSNYYYFLLWLFFVFAEIL